MRRALPVAVVMALGSGGAFAADVAVGMSGGEIEGTHGRVLVQISTTTPGPANNVVLTIPLPAGITFEQLVGGPIPLPPPECTTPPFGQGGSIVCTRETFSGTAFYVLFFRTTAALPEGSTVALTASVSTTSGDDDPANNVSSFDVPVIVGLADVAVSKRLVSSERITGGVRLTYELRATNLGPYAAHDVRLSDDPLLAITAESFTCGNSIPDPACCPIRCLASELAPGETFTLTFVGTVTDQLIVHARNRAVVVSLGDENGENNEVIVSAIAPAIPTLAQWSMLALITAFAMAGLLLLRKQSL